MLHLPLDIIEKIIISSDMILTTHNTILKLVKLMLSKYDTLSKSKDKNLKYQHYLSIYLFLSNKTTLLNIYKHSRWYNYFIDIQKHNSKNNNTNTNTNTNTTNTNTNLIIDTINKKIIHNLNLIKSLIVFDNYKYNDYNSLIELNINNTDIKILIQYILLYWKINITDLGSFILLIIVLVSGNTFKSKTNLHIENHLYMKFIKEKEDISSNMNMNIYTPCYFNPNNNLIPLFQKSIGMGYTYNIAWDILIKKYIGFLFGGSSAEDFYYFDNKLKVYLYKNASERIDYIKKNKKIININKLIEVLIVNDNKSISYYEKICIN